MNLVFDKWDEFGNPLPNLSELNSKDKFAPFPFFIPESDLPDKMGMEDITIKKCKPNEINLNEKFYYIISLRFSFLFCIKHSDIFLPKEIQYHIKNNNLKVIFLCEVETHKYYDIFIELLIKKIKKNNWKEENFYIIDNNSIHKDIKEKFNTNINFFKINYLLYCLGKLTNKMSADNLLMDKKFIFLCHNREPHHHRILFLSHLKHLKLLEDNIINWSLIFRHTGENTTVDSVSLTRFKDYIDVNNKELVSDFAKLRKSKKICYYENDMNIINANNDKYNFDMVGYVTETSFQNAYINIVTETHFIFGEGIHITEKSFKPFYYFQLPIFLALHNHVKTLKDEYGFYLFDDLINHSYDDEKDDAKRFHMVVNEIKRLSNMREEISLYYKNNIDKLIHNHNIIKNNQAEQSFKEYILNI
jgi:hypothetical protein